MTVTVKNKTPLVVAPAVRRQAGLKTGDELEFKVSAGVITILPKLPTADDEYTPEQRRIVDRGIAKGLDDIKKGRVHDFCDIKASILPWKGRTQNRVAAVLPFHLGCGVTSVTKQMSSSILK